MTDKDRDGLPSVLFYAELSQPFTPDDLRHRALGGSETALIRLTQGLARQGHAVTVVAHPGQRTGIFDGVRYLDVSKPTWRAQQADVGVVFRQLPHARRPIPGRIRLLWVHDHIGIFPETPPGPRRALLQTAWRLGYPLFGRRVPGVVAVSRWLAGCFVEFARWPREQVWALPNGIDPELFSAEVGASHGDPKRPPRLLYTSVPERGLRLLLTAIMPGVWKECPETQLHVYSYRPLQAYEDFAKAHPGRVCFHGAVPKQELALALAAGDLWVYPTDFPETSCIAAMEAQAAGLPVVSSRRYALPETVEDGGSGWLIDGAVGSSEYVRRFTSAVIALLKDPARRRAMGAHGRERVLQEFTWERVAARWSALLLELMNGSARWQAPT